MLHFEEVNTDWKISVYTLVAEQASGELFNYGDTLLPSKGSACYNMTELFDFSERCHSPSGFTTKPKTR